MNADGSSLARLTHNTASDTGPAWGPPSTPVPPAPTVKGLMDTVNALVLGASAKRPLFAVLAAANRAIDTSKRATQLNAFIALVQNMARKGQLSAGSAAELIGDAEAILSS